MSSGLLDRLVWHRTLPANPLGRDFFVGDLHGELERLLAALRSRDFDPGADRLISVGDLIDRGPDSHGCLHLLECSWFECVLGNHEWMFLRQVVTGDEEDKLLHWRAGGKWSSALDAGTAWSLCELIVDRCTLALSVPLGSQVIGVTHNDVLDNDWDRMRRGGKLEDIDRCVWSRQRFKMAVKDPLAIADIAHADVVVSGHNTHAVPIWAGNQVYIDTLAASGKLTLPTAEELLINLASAH